MIIVERQHDDGSTRRLGYCRARQQLERRRNMGRGRTQRRRFTTPERCKRMRLVGTERLTAVCQPCLRQLRVNRQVTDALAGRFV